MNPLFLSDPHTVCPVCGTNLRDGTTNGLRPCPLGHMEDPTP